MKKVLVASFLAAIACGPISSFGQSPAPAASDTPVAAPSVAAPAAPRSGLANISPAESDTLRAANQKAQKDPAVQAAAEKMRAARKAAADAIVAKDKSLAPLFDKIEAASAASQRVALTADERQQLNAGFDSIKGTPEADAFQKSNNDFRQVVRQAMIAADPSVAAILAKLPQPTVTHAGPGAPRPAASASATPQ
jgi:hypothetical protein